MKSEYYTVPEKLPEDGANVAVTISITKGAANIFLLSNIMILRLQASKHTVIVAFAKNVRIVTTSRHNDEIATVANEGVWWNKF